MDRIPIDFYRRALDGTVCVFEHMRLGGRCGPPGNSNVESVTCILDLKDDVAHAVAVPLDMISDFFGPIGRVAQAVIGRGHNKGGLPLREHIGGSIPTSGSQSGVRNPGKTKGLAVIVVRLFGVPTKNST